MRFNFFFEIAWVGRDRFLIIKKVQVHLIIFGNHSRNQDKKLNQMSSESQFHFFSWDGLLPRYDDSGIRNRS